VAGRLSGNNRPVDTPPIPLNTTFDYSSSTVVKAEHLNCAARPFCVRTSEWFGQLTIGVLAA
jgi:hypothetical protein